MSIYVGAGGVRREVSAGGNKPAAYKKETKRQWVYSSEPMVIELPVYDGSNIWTVKVRATYSASGSIDLTKKYWGVDAGDGKWSCPLFIEGAYEKNCPTYVSCDGAQMIGLILKSNGTCTAFNTTGTITSSTDGDLIWVMYISPAE